MLVLSLFACFMSQPPEPVAKPAPVEKQERVVPALAKVQAAGRRVVAIGDLHGDRDASKAVLELAGLIGPDEAWVGGTTVLVQTGDTTDRGPDSKGVIDLLRSLVEPARAAGGEVVLLNGNHEIMNLQGDWRYVSEADTEGFGGIAGRRKAFAKDGDYGRFLRTLPVVAQVDDLVFAHGGVTQGFAELGVEGVNTTARLHYDDPPGPDGHPVHGETGPTWYRGFVHDPESLACPHLERALAALGATRMIVGHTTQRTGVVLSRCEGRFTVIDVGISAHYGGNLGAWEYVDGDARFLTATGIVDLPEPEAIASPGRPE